MGAKRTGAAALFLALSIAGCSESQDVQASPPTLSPAGVGPMLTEASWTDGRWPFTVPSGVLKCYIEDSMVTFTADDTEYALNPPARKFGDYPDISEILREEPDAFVDLGEGNLDRIPMEANFSRVLARAAGLCKRFYG